VPPLEATLCYRSCRELGKVVTMSSTLEGTFMKASIAAIAVTFAIAYSGSAFAADATSQPLTRADCGKAGMTWNDGANVCGSVAAATAKSEANKSEATEVKKATSGESKKARSHHKTTKHYHHTPPKKQEHRFFKWLNGNGKNA
jgi:hypothetical protein